MIKWCCVLIVALLSATCALAEQPLRILCEIAPPSQYYGADGRLTGYSVELVKRIQAKVNNADPIEVMPWTRAYRTIKTSPRVVLFMTAKLAERRDQFKWVGPLLNIEFVLYGRSEDKPHLQTLEQAKQLRSIGVYRDDARDLFLTRLGFTNLYRVAKNESLVRMLMAGRFDAYAGTDTGNTQFVRASGVNEDRVKDLLHFHEVEMYIAMSKDMPDDVVQRWHAALAELKQDGTMATLFRRFYFDDLRH